MNKLLQLFNKNSATCSKGGFHKNELVNMVCLEETCISSEKTPLIGCLICMQEYHQDHNVSSIKCLLHEYKQSINKQRQSLTSNSEQIIASLNHFAQDYKKMVCGLQLRINEKFKTVLNEFDHYFQNIMNQFSQALQLSNIEQLISNYNSGSSNDPNKSMRDILKNNLEQINSTSYNGKIDLKLKAFKVVNEQLLIGVDQDINVALDRFFEFYSNKNSQVFSRQSYNFTFTSSYKHANVSLLFQNLKAKSTTSNIYKFALLEPQIDFPMEPVKFGFKITKLTTGHWVAIGVCYRNIVKSNHYQFTYDTTDHGAHMISANGGSWSCLEPSNNNKVKAFKFGQDDIISVTISQSAKKIIFQKLKTKQKYEMDMNYGKDYLHPCVLFYHTEDEVEFLNEEFLPI